MQRSDLTRTTPYSIPGSDARTLIDAAGYHDIEVEQMRQDGVFAVGFGLDRRYQAIAARADCFNSKLILATCAKLVAAR